MYEPNVRRILDSLSPQDIVLDVGGWACPFNRANYIVDTSPYETRGYYKNFGGKAFQGPEQESFTRDTWFQRDICDRSPFPFADKSIDFAICSHTLEDIRDPVWVCSELVRVAKRGYIEVPSRVAESCRGWESPRIAGLTHHRWLVEIEGNRVSFAHKTHAMHKHWRFSLPPSHLRSLAEEERVSWLFWEGSFEFAETTGVLSIEDTERALSAYVASVRPYPAWKLAASSAWRTAESFAMRGYGYLRRRVLPGT